MKDARYNKATLFPEYLVDLTTAKQARNIQGLFTRIAPRYDLMNRLMTFGQDEVVRRAAPAPSARLLDLGTGTGDLARAALRQFPAVRVTAASGFRDIGFRRLMLGTVAIHWGVRA
ncbi:MAG: hypothetical protein C0393_00725 [Anaerolinea sp.]|nr:hypothetical protein [Anaerolinea sp.]